MKPLEKEGRRLIAEMAEFLRACGAGEVAEAHLAAITEIVRPHFTATIVGKGDIKINPKLLFGPKLEGLQAAVERRLDYSSIWGGDDGKES